MSRDYSTTKVPFVSVEGTSHHLGGESANLPSEASGFFFSVEKVDPICSFSPALEPQDAGNPRIWKIYGDLISLHVYICLPT